jgi:hypothetical protein
MDVRRCNIPCSDISDNECRADRKTYNHHTPWLDCRKEDGKECACIRCLPMKYEMDKSVSGKHLFGSLFEGNTDFAGQFVPSLVLLGMRDSTDDGRLRDDVYKGNAVLDMLVYMLFSGI